MKKSIVLTLLLLLTACVPLQVQQEIFDRDQDGVADEFDNCVDDFNPYQYDKDKDNKGYICDHNVYLRAGTFDPLMEDEEYLINITQFDETGYYFVQFLDSFDYTLLDHFLFSISAKSVDVFEGEVHIIKTNTTLNTILTMHGVRSAGIYQPINRIEPALFLNRFLYENGSIINSQDSIILEIYIYDNFAEVKNKLLELDAQVLSDSIDILLIQINQFKLIDVMLIPDINFINPNPVLQYGNSYAAMITGAKKVNEHFKLTGSGEIVTVADSGLDTGVIHSLHPDLQQRIIRIEDMGTQSTKDLTGHGTHVASSIVGSGKSSHGELKGSAPGAKIIFQAIGRELPEKAYSDDPLLKQKGGSRLNPIHCFGKAQVDPKQKVVIKTSYSSMDLSGIPLDYSLLFKNATIHTNSWGSCQGVYTPKVSKIDEVLWNNKEQVILFSAGNQAGFIFIENNTIMQKGGDSLTNTARTKNAIIVGATDSSRIISNKAKNSEKIASFSSKGDEHSGRIKPDLVAPGTWIMSARSSSCVDGSKIQTVEDSGIVETKFDFNHDKCVGKGLPSTQNLSFNDDLYMFNSGTSMATPHVAGLVALTREYYKKIKGHKRPSSALVKATLINGAKDLPDQSLGLIHRIKTNISCNGYPNMCEGWGLVNITNSLYPQGKYEYLWFSDSKAILKSNQNIEFSINFIDYKPIYITLVWTDLPFESLQNDLDLIVVSPSGKRYLGNTFTTDGKKSIINPIAKNTRLNNNIVEKVIIEQAEKGEYTLTVVGKKIRSSQEQPFALVASNFKS